MTPWMEDLWRWLSGKEREASDWTRLMWARDQHLLERVQVLEKWMHNLDAALWQVAQKLPGADAQPSVTAAHLVLAPDGQDRKQVSAQIVAEVMAAKTRFPLSPEDLQ